MELLFIVFTLIICIHVCMNVCIYYVLCALVHVWISEDNLWDSILFFSTYMSSQGRNSGPQAWWPVAFTH